MAHARSVPGHTTSGDARVPRPEDHEEAESQGEQKRLPAGDPADLLWSSAGLPGQDEQRRPSPGNCFTCQHAAALLLTTNHLMWWRLRNRDLT